MNIIEAYIKFNGQMVVLISGMSGCGKTKFAKKISEKFNIKYLDEVDYYKKDYAEKKTLPGGSEIINWDSDDAVDWVKLNKDIDEHKTKGVIVSGFSFPQDKITSEVNYHIQLSLSKKKCLEIRHKFLEKNKEKFPEEYEKIDSKEELLKMNQLTYPYYLDVIKRSKINKFINVNKFDDDQIFDMIWDLLISHIQRYLANRDKTKSSVSSPSPSSISSNIDE